MKRAYIVWLALLLTGCGSKKEMVYVPVKETEQVTIERHDTTVVERLVPYYSEQKKARRDSSHLSNPYAYSDAWWDGDTLRHTLGIWPWASLTVTLPTYKEVFTRVQEKPVTVTETVEKKLTLWQRARLWACVPSVLINLVLLFCLYRRKIRLIS
jgi:hypothetical protein